MRIATMVSLGAAFLLLPRTSPAQPGEVTYGSGLVTIQCKDAPLSSIFEKIEAAAGIELTLEDEVKSKKLTANLIELPVSMAVARLLEGVGVNYIVMMDPDDWGRVGKIFVGAGGGGPARAAGPVRAPVVQEEPEESEVVEEAFEDVLPESFDEGAQGMDPGDVDPGLEGAPEDMLPEDLGVGEDPEAFAPPGSSPLPEFLPPAQSFPRSSFTPGLPRANPRSPGAQPQQQGIPGMPGMPGMEEQDPNAPPAAFPFTDPFGRPIPVQPGMNQQNRRQQQQRQRQQQQQQEQP